MPRAPASAGASSGSNPRGPPRPSREAARPPPSRLGPSLGRPQLAGLGNRPGRVPTRAAWAGRGLGRPCSALSLPRTAGRVETDGFPLAPGAAALQASHAITYLPLWVESLSLRGALRAGNPGHPSENWPPSVQEAPSRLIIKQSGEINFYRPLRFSPFLFVVAVTSFFNQKPTTITFTLTVSKPHISRFTHTTVQFHRPRLG